MGKDIKYYFYENILLPSLKKGKEIKRRLKYRKIKMIKKSLQKKYVRLSIYFILFFFLWPFILPGWWLPDTILHVYVDTHTRLSRFEQYPNPNYNPTKPVTRDNLPPGWTVVDVKPPQGPTVPGPKLIEYDPDEPVSPENLPPGWTRVEIDEGCLQELY